MARLIPNQVMPGRSVAFARVFRLCKSLSDDYVIWQAMTGDAGRADLLLVFEECRAMPVMVSDITPQDWLDYQQRELFKGDEHPFPSRRERLETATDCVVFFPLLDDSTARQVLPDRAFLSREDLRPERFEALLQPLLSELLDDAAISHLRADFCPETVIPASLSVRPLVERNLRAGLTDMLLDLDQEAILKNDLHLEQGGEALVRSLNVRLVTGVAGSGKSLLVLYRLRLLRELLGPESRMLVLTHNRALIRDLQARYLILSGNDQGVEFKTFLAWCHDHWPHGFPGSGPIHHRERVEIAKACIETHLADTAIKPERLLEEIDWVKDTFNTKNEYLQADRAGRGFRLSESLRERVYAAIEQYQQEMDAQGAIDWGDVPRRLWQMVQAGEAALPRYDAIFVDEAQFFAPYWFSLIKFCLNSATAQLFIVADPTQGFLKRRQSWSALGLEVRGRAQKLERSYRTTQSILSFANLLYRERNPDDEEALLSPELHRMPVGIMPTVIPLSSPQDETSRVVNEVVALITSGAKPSSILIIHADSGAVKTVIDRLNQTDASLRAVDPRNGADGEAVRVCSLNASTGLESPIVFLLGIHQLYEKEQSIYLAEDERSELIRDNTRKLYMAITRTGQRLVITYVGVLPQVLEGLA